jgi:hypothetical protein
MVAQDPQGGERGGEVRREEDDVTPGPHDADHLREKSPRALRVLEDVQGAGGRERVSLDVGRRFEVGYDEALLASRQEARREVRADGGEALRAQPPRAVADAAPDVDHRCARRNPGPEELEVRLEDARILRLQHPPVVGRRTVVVPHSARRRPFAGHGDRSACVAAVGR